MAEKQVVTHKVSYRIADENDEGQRLDNYLARILKGVPRSMLYRILRRGEVRVNKGRVTPSYKLKAGDNIRIPPVTVTEGPVTIPSSNLHLVQDLKDRILFENDDLLVVNKPAGLAAHGGSGIEFGLIESLRALKPEQRFLELAHRLDKETSGCLIVAKRRSALRNLHEQFRQRIVKKRYLTLVPGKWDRRVHLVDAPLVRNELRSGERMVEVSFKNGAPSSTGFDVVGFCPGLIFFFFLLGSSHFPPSSTIWSDSSFFEIGSSFLSSLIGSSSFFGSSFTGIVSSFLSSSVFAYFNMGLMMMISSHFSLFSSFNEIKSNIIFSLNAKISIGLNS